MSRGAVPFDLRLSDVLLIFGVACLSIVPVLLAGPPVGTADLVHHLQLANAYTTAFSEGHIFSDWVAAENHGYGSVAVRFYPPLLHLTLAAFESVLQKWHLAVFAAFAMWSAVGSLGVFLWARDIFNSRYAAIAAGCIFAFSPYHLNQFYNSFMWGEYAALSVLPFVFLFARRVCIRGTAAEVISLGAAMGLLVLGNLPQTVVGITGAAAYAIFFLNRTGTAKQIGRLAAAGIVGMLCSSFYWVRVVYEAGWINISQPNTDPVYDFRNHFLLNSFDLDAQGLWFASLMLVASVAGAFLAVSVAGRLKSVLAERETRAVVGIGIFSILMLLPVSRLIWEFVTPLQRIQFPWRFLSIISLCSSLMIGYSICAACERSSAIKRPARLVLAGIVLIFATFAVKQVILGAYTTTAAEFDELPAQSLAANGLAHWRPVWANDGTFDIPREVAARGRGVTITRWEPTIREFEISPGAPVQARAAIMYYPLWQASVNGEPADTRSTGGALAIDVGPQLSNVKLRFVEPAYTGYSRTVSLFAWLAVIVTLLLTLVRKSQIKDYPEQ